MHERVYDDFLAKLTEHARSVHAGTDEEAKLGPMTLPCIGPLVVSAFVLGAGSATSLASSLLYTLAFGLGFGWPLVLLPLLAVPLQRHLTRWLAGRYSLLTRASGLILLGIGLFGLWAEVLPSLPSLGG